MRNIATRQLPTSTAELFAAGNYTSVVMTGGPDQWQTYAAMGLIGKTREAIEGLSRFSHQEARFYLAVANWIDGDEAVAMRILETIPTPHAQNLLALIRKPQIRVLAQLPWIRHGPWDLITAAAQDSKFIVRNISFHPEDLPNEPYADIHKFYDPHNPPDFYICQMVEWHIIPPNLQELPCPIFGQTADYDLHIQTVYPWLKMFDELIVTDQTEWQDVRRLVGIPVSTFPKSFGVADRLPSLTHQTRKFDVFVSGTLLHPYHPDKAKLYHQILRLPDINPLFINGFMLPVQYKELLCQSKVCFTYYRRSGGTVTRGLEALSMGCAVVVQKGCVLTLYVGEQEGVLTYELKAEDLVPTIRQILDQWLEFEQRTQRGAEIIRREFALQRVASQYLRFLTFLTAKPRNQRQRQPIELLDQKRSIVWKGWLPGESYVLHKMRKRNLARWEARLEVGDSPQLVNDMARELVLECATRACRTYDSPTYRELLDQALRFYRIGLTRFPQSLVLRFNLIRTALHFGWPQDVSEALELTEEVLSKPASSWQIDIKEDIFPWDFCSTFFNYRKYFDLITEHLSQGTSIHSILIQLILASLHYYLGHYLGSFDHFKQAFRLDPDFPFYKLWYAKQLMNRGEPEDDAEAGSLLVQLAENSIVFIEAYYLLRQLQVQQRFKSPKLIELTQMVDQAERYTLFLEEDLGDKTLQLLYDSPVQPFTLPSSSGVTVHKRRDSQTIVKVSVILLNWSCRESFYALDWLSRQNVPRDQYELIWVELDNRMVPQAMEKADVVITCGQDGLYHKHVGYNLGLLHAKGQVITICDSDAIFPPDFIASIIVSFNLNSLGKPSSVVLRHHEWRTSEHYPKELSNINELKLYSWTKVWPNMGTCISIRKVDAIRFGGFDEHSSFRGYFGGLYDLGRRLVSAGIPETWYDESVVLWRFAHPDPPSFFSQSFSWELWHEVAYPYVENLRANFNGKLLPRKENPEVHKIRRSLCQMGIVYGERYATMPELLGFSKWERLKLYLTLISETYGLSRKKQFFEALKKDLKKLTGPEIYEVLKAWWHSQTSKKSFSRVNLKG